MTNGMWRSLASSNSDGDETVLTMKAMDIARHRPTPSIRRFAWIQAAIATGGLLPILAVAAAGWIARTNDCPTLEFQVTSCFVRGVDVSPVLSAILGFWPFALSAVFLAAIAWVIHTAHFIANRFLR
jgi:hypothetical protein